jgi:aminoglycoside phosphotransferase (APT) family kinase protein
MTVADGIPLLTPVRERHRFDEAALADYLKGRLPDFDGTLEVQQFEGGQSNPTYLLRSRGRSYVLRKKPPGQLLKSAHQVDREYRVITALRDTDVPVPETYVMCDDEDVIGTIFFVMEHVEGRVFANSALPGFAPEERRALYLDSMRVLAALHSVDPEAVGLADFGRPGNYYLRQISRWTKQYEASKTEEIESMNRLMEWLPAHVPESDESCIVHGDFRLGNCIVHPTEPRIAAVLDWEISTQGHPLADLAYFCLGYHGEGASGDSLLESDLESLGIPSERELLDHYCGLTGRESIEHWSFYIVFQMYRAAAIVQGVYKRGLDGNASSDMAATFGELVESRADAAWRMVQG